MGVNRTGANRTIKKERVTGVNRTGANRTLKKEHVKR